MNATWKRGVPQNPPGSATKCNMPRRGAIRGEVLTTFPPARTEMSTQAYEWNREHKQVDAWIRWSINLLQLLVRHGTALYKLAQSTG